MLSKHDYIINAVAFEYKYDLRVGIPPSTYLQAMCGMIL